MKLDINVCNDIPTLVCMHMYVCMFVKSLNVINIVLVGESVHTHNDRYYNLDIIRPDDRCIQNLVFLIITSCNIAPL